MNSAPRAPRLTRLLREVEISIVPTLLLLAACAALSLLLVLDALKPVPATQAAHEPVTHLAAPAA
jgi:hypothetical protein